MRTTTIGTIEAGKSIFVRCCAVRGLTYRSNRRQKAGSMNYKWLWERECFWTMEKWGLSDVNDIYLAVVRNCV